MAYPDPQNFGFTITTKDVWMRLDETSAEMSRGMSEIRDAVMEVKGQIGTIQTADMAQQRWRNDIESRVRRLEFWRYSLPTSLGLAIIALATAIITALK